MKKGSNKFLEKKELLTGFTIRNMVVGNTDRYIHWKFPTDISINNFR